MTVDVQSAISSTGWNRRGPGMLPILITPALYVGIKPVEWVMPRRAKSARGPRLSRTSFGAAWRAR